MYAAVLLDLSDDDDAPSPTDVTSQVANLRGVNAAQIVVDKSGDGSGFKGQIDRAFALLAGTFEGDDDDKKPEHGKPEAAGSKRPDKADKGSSDEPAA